MHAQVSMLSLALVLATAPSSRSDIVIRVAGRVSSTPTIAARGAFVAVAFGAAGPGGETDVFAAISRDGGRTFGAPVRVNNVDGDARLNGEQPPAVGLVERQGREPAIVVVWTTKRAAGTTLLHTRSDDGGRTFAPATSVPGADAPGNRGWEAIAVAPTGRVDVAWLDHRELAADTAMAASHHDHSGGASRPDGVALAQKSKLFVASLDRSLAPRSVTGGVCYCCKTALAAGSDGAIYAAWRHVYPGNLRDMAFTVSHDTGRTFAPPIRVSEDGWVLEGCPDDGPAMTLEAGGRVHVAWPTIVADGKDAEPTIGLFYSMSLADASAHAVRFSPRTRIPTEGLPHHPRIVVAPDGTLVAAWDESQNGERHVAAARALVDSAGRPTFRRERLSADIPSMYPALASASDAVVAAWTSGSSSSSQISVARIPGFGSQK